MHHKLISCIMLMISFTAEIIGVSTGAFISCIGAVAITCYCCCPKSKSTKKNAEDRSKQLITVNVSIADVLLWVVSVSAKLFKNVSWYYHGLTLYAK